MSSFNIEYILFTLENVLEIGVLYLVSQLILSTFNATLVKGKVFNSGRLGITIANIVKKFTWQEKPKAMSYLIQFFYIYVSIYLINFSSDLIAPTLEKKMDLNYYGIIVAFSILVAISSELRSGIKNRYSWVLLLIGVTILMTNTIHNLERLYHGQMASFLQEVGVEFRIVSVSICLFLVIYNFTFGFDFSKAKRGTLCDFLSFVYLKFYLSYILSFVELKFEYLSQRVAIDLLILIVYICVKKLSIFNDVTKMKKEMKIIIKYLIPVNLLSWVMVYI